MKCPECGGETFCLVSRNMMDLGVCAKCEMSRQTEIRKDAHGMYTEQSQPATNQWTPRLLEAAIEATTGARNADYGNPWDNHNRTAELWSFWLRHSKGIDVILTDLDVCMFNMLQKISRLTNGVEHYDSWVDLAGYAGNAGVCMDVHSGKIKVSGVPQDEIGEL